MLNRDLLYYDTFDSFNRLKLAANAANTKYTIGMEGAQIDGAPLIAWQTAVFIGDTRQIWMRGKLWSCANGQEIEIDKIRYVGGRFILSPAAITCSEVQYLDASGNVLPNYGSLNEADQQPTSFKCYFRQRDEWGRERKNEFTQGDFALCQTLTPTRGGATAKPSYYWRLVIGRGNDWIQLSNKPGEYDPNSTWPAADDDIVMFGSRSVLRQSALMLSSYGDGSPSITKYAGISAMNLTEGIPFDGFASRYIVTLDGFDAATGRAFYRSFGDFYFGNPDSTTYVRYSQDSGVEIMANKIGLHTQYNQQIDLQQQLESMGVYIDKVQMQADRQFTIWYADEETTMDGLVHEWESEDVILEHDQDIFYDVDGETGLAWRFVVTDDFGNSFEWRQIDDQDTLRALEIAKSKKRVFLAEPIPPYDEGDLWVKVVSYTDQDGNTQSKKDMMTCTTAKKKGESFADSDWAPATVTHADLELLGNKFRLYVTYNDKKLVEIEGKIEGETASLNAIVKSAKETIESSVRTAAGYASSASGSESIASMYASSAKTYRDNAKTSEEKCEGYAKDAKKAETYWSSIDAWAKEGGAGFTLLAAAEKAAEDAGGAAEEYMNSSKAQARIEAVVDDKTSKLKLSADQIDFDGHTVSFNTPYDSVQGELMTGTMNIGENAMTVHSESKTSDDWYTYHFTSSFGSFSSNTSNGWFISSISSQAFSLQDKGGYYFYAGFIPYGKFKNEFGVYSDYVQCDNLAIGNNDVRIVSSLPSDASSHPDTIYIVKG